MNITSKQSPCHGCTERRVGCHGECERFIAWDKNHRAENARVYKIKQTQRQLDDYVHDTIFKMSKKGGTKNR